MSATKVLWFSQHEMSDEQKKALQLVYGQDMELNHVNRTVRNMYDIQDDIRNADVVAMVGTVDMQSQAIKIADGKPVITAVSDRVLTKDEDGNVSKVAFVFNRWEQVKSVEISKEDYHPSYDQPVNVLWFSRHQMSPEQEAALALPDGSKIVQIDKTVNSAYDIADDINKADLVALVAPVGIQQQALNIIHKAQKDTPLITAVNDRIPQEDGTYKFSFNKWEQVKSISVEKEDLVTAQDVRDHDDKLHGIKDTHDCSSLDEIVALARKETGPRQDNSDRHPGMENIEVSEQNFTH